MNSLKKGLKIMMLVLLILILLIVLLIGIFFLLRNRINHHQNIQNDPNTGVFILTAADEIVFLEKGLVAVRFDGDSGFDAFLEFGGAKNDAELLDFYKNYTGHMNTNLGIKSKGFGCSVVSAPNVNGGYWFGRNFDFISCNAMIVESHPINGYASFSTVDLDFIHLGSKMQSLFMNDAELTRVAQYIPLDGMNEKGVCISVNMIQDGRTIQQNTDKTDLTTTTAVRLILDKAATTDEAIELLSSCDLHASFNFMIHYAISDAGGHSVVVEYVNNEMVVTETPVVTNFYFAEARYGIGTAQSMTRYNTLMDALKEKKEMTRNDVRDMLCSVGKHNFDDGETTEWSAVFDQNELTACYYHREDYSTPYLFKLVPNSESKGE